MIMVTQNAHRCARQAELARLVAERCPEHVFIGTRTPYELGDLPQVRNYLAAYSSRPEALRACAEVLLGKREAKGRLPVTLA